MKVNTNNTNGGDYPNACKESNSFVAHLQEL